MLEWGEMSAPADPIAMLLRRWRTVLICAFLGGAAGTAYALLSPPWYASSLAVIPSQRSPNPSAAMLSNLPAMGLLGSSMSTDVQRIQAVLTSTSVADEVISKFSLKERYGIEHIELVRAELGKHCGTSVDRRSGVVTLTCEDKEPEVAMQMAAYYGDVGNRVFGRISASSAREERTFLESQLVKARAQVDAASRALREFQETHRIIDLGEQSKAVISAMASIQGELVTKQLQLNYLLSFSSATGSNVSQLQQQIRVMQAKLKQLETAQPTTGTKSEDSKFFPEAMQVPELRFELEQLFREQKIAETVFLLMTQRYETAKVDEARDTSTFQILDAPTLPTYKSRPKRVKAVVMGLGGGAGIALALVFIPAWWRRRSTIAVT